MRFCKLTIAAALVALASAAGAQDWPSRPLTMVVPFAAGGPMDTLARILQPALGETLGQQIIIENQPGGGGMTGSLRVSQASPDSHSFVLASIGTHAIGHSMHSKPPYHPANDFQPVIFVADTPLMLMTKKDLPPNNLKEFTAYAKANHDKMTFSSGGTGTSSHVSCVMLNQIMGVDVTHVPYRGGGPAFADVIAGRIDYICNYVSIGAPAVNQGQVKAIAMLARERTPLLPELPTADEQGLKDFDVSAWNAILLPKSATPVRRHRADRRRAEPAQPGIPAHVHQRGNREMGQARAGERPEGRLTNLTAATT
jgi:tripartite-type tricarboxylate transporter receptor subunit TctC